MKRFSRAPKDSRRTLGTADRPIVMAFVPSQDTARVTASGKAIAASLEASTGRWRTAVDGLRAAAREEDNPHFRLQAHLERATTVSRLDPEGGREEVRESVAAALGDAGTAGCRRHGS